MVSHKRGDRRRKGKNRPLSKFAYFIGYKTFGKLKTFQKLCRTNRPLSKMPHFDAKSIKTGHFTEGV
jgi:hypothetical protein